MFTQEHSFTFEADGFLDFEQLLSNKLLFRTGPDVPEVEIEVKEGFSGERPLRSSHWFSVMHSLYKLNQGASEDTAVNADKQAQ